MNINIISFNNSICDFVYNYHGLALVKSVEFTIIISGISTRSETGSRNPILQLQ